MQIWTTPACDKSVLKGLNNNINNCLFEDYSICDENVSSSPPKPELPHELNPMYEGIAGLHFERPTTWLQEMVVFYQEDHILLSFKMFNLSESGLTMRSFIRVIFQEGDDYTYVLRDILLQKYIYFLSLNVPSSSPPPPQFSCLGREYFSADDLQSSFTQTGYLFNNKHYRAHASCLPE